MLTAGALAAETLPTAPSKDGLNGGNELLCQD